MSTLNQYEPSQFLAMFDSKSNGDNYSHVIGIAASEPHLTLETGEFRGHITTSRSAQTASDSQTGITLVLHGELYDCSKPDQAEHALKRYTTRGLDFAKDLDGSFAILIVDIRENAIHVITDRLNSRDIFYSHYGGVHWFSSSLKIHPIQNVKLDPVGLACYLANGAVLNNRTIYEGISVLERGTIHTLTATGLRASRYWNHHYTNEHAGKDRNKLHDELADILIEAVRKRVSDGANIFVSLSGGYDSATILGIMVRNLKMIGVTCISYTYGDPKSDSDPGTAKRMAEFLNCPFKLVQSYSGDVTRALRTNAEIGHAMNKYCEDAEAWQGLKSDFVKALPSALIVGDECFGDVPFLRFTEIKTLDDVLECNGIHKFDRWSWLYKFTQGKYLKSMKEGWRGEISSIMKRCPPSENLLDYKDFLYLDQRVNHITFSWRQHIMGDHVNVRQPLLDNAIVEFVSRLPADQRLFKRLYVEAVTKMFPDLFNLGICRSAPGSYPNWALEFVSQKAAIERLLQEPSRLDDIISPNAIRHLINTISLCQSSEFKAIPAKFIRKARRSRKVPAIIRQMLGGDTRNDVEYIDETVMLQRLLVLRLVLQQIRK